MTRWEYKRLVDSYGIPDSQLNELGAKGWELVAAEFSKSGKIAVVGAVFKRPLPPETINVPYTGSMTTIPPSGWTGSATPIRPVGRSMELPEHLTRG